MTLVAWMAGVSAAVWVTIAAVAEPEVGRAALVGMLGPLAAVSISWVTAERAFRRRPESLTGVMVAGFAAKMVFFAAYVIAAVKVFATPAVPFVASFTAYFIGLYLTEALALRRLFAS